MPTRDYLPLTGLPASRLPKMCTEHWHGQDNLSAYRERGGHPRYGESDIAYRYNSRGYRCVEFETDAQLRMISIGCSYTFGLGLPQDALFHELFATKLRAERETSVVNWNLGVPGASNDSIARLLHLAVPTLNPDIVVVLFTHPARREYLSPHGQLVQYSPAAGRQASTAMREIYGHFTGLVSEPDDMLNFFANYKSIEALLRGRTWLCAIADPAEIEPAALGHVDARRSCGEMKKVDNARDYSHPGPVSHQGLFQSTWETFERMGKF